jgi:hypothetical protein
MNQIDTVADRAWASAGCALFFAAASSRGCPSPLSRREHV